MAQTHFDKFIPLYTEFSEELYECILRYFRLVMGFSLGYAFYNYQSFLDWSLTISVMHFIITKINAKLLAQFLPEDLHFLLYKNILAESLALGVICFLTQQSLPLLVLSRLLYIAFSFYGKMFSHSLLESIGIAYYLKSLWFLLPVGLNFIISSMYLLDISLETNMVNYFFDLPIVSGVLNEIGVNVEGLSKYKKDHFGQSNPYFSLIVHDESFFNDLKMTFLKSSAQHHLKNQLGVFKKEIMDLYQKNPAHVIHADQIIQLPLHWNDFKLILDAYPNLQEQMYQAYYRNSYHTLWRLLQYHNPWLAADTISLKQHHAFQQSHYREMLLLLWSRAKMNHHDEQFFHDIARIYRNRNHSRTKFRFFSQELDNLKADMPGPIEYFHHYVLQHLGKHKEINLLTHYQIKKHWQEEIKIYWKRYLDSLTVEDFFELRYLWKEVLSKNNERHLNHFKVMDLDETFKDDFIFKMKTQYGQKWKSFHTDYVNQLFVLAHTDHSHVEKYAISFSNLIKRHFNEDIPKKLGRAI